MANNHCGPGSAEPPVCADCPTRRQAEWRVLPNRVMATVAREKITRRYAAGEAVFLREEPVTGLFCVAAGLLMLRIPHASGGTVAVGLAHAGETVGYRDFFEQARYSVSAVALAPATVCEIPRGVMEGLLGEFPALGEAFRHRIAADGEALEMALVRLALCPLRQRLAHVLLELLPRYSHSGAPGQTVLELPISWRDISSLVWSRPETVSRTLKDLSEGGVLTMRGAKVTIPNVDRLREEVSPS